MKKIQIFLLALVTIFVSYMAGLYVFAQTSMPKPPSLDLFNTQVDFGDSLKGATLIKDEPQKAEDFAGGVKLISFTNNQKLAVDSFDSQDCKIIPAKTSGKPNFLIADRAMSLSELFLENVRPNNAVHIFGSFGVGERKLRKFNITPHNIVKNIRTEYCCEELDFNNKFLRPGDVVYYYNFANDFTGLDTQRCEIPELDVNPIDFKGSGWYLNYVSSVDFIDVLSNTQRLDSLYKINLETGQPELFWPPTKDSFRQQQLRGRLPNQKKESLIENGFEPGVYWIQISRVPKVIDRVDTEPIADNTLRVRLDDSGTLACENLDITFKLKLESNSDFPILFSGFEFEQLDRVNYSLEYGPSFRVDSVNGRFDVNSRGGEINEASLELREDGLMIYPRGEIDFDLTISIELESDNTELELQNVSLDARLIGSELDLNTQFTQSAVVFDQCANNIAADSQNVNFSCDEIRNAVDNLTVDKNINVINNRRLLLDLNESSFNIIDVLPGYLRIQANEPQENILPSQNGLFNFQAILILEQYINSGGSAYTGRGSWTLDGLETSDFEVTVPECSVNSISATAMSVTNLGDEVENASLSCNQKNAIRIALTNNGVNEIDLAGENILIDVSDINQIQIPEDGLVAGGNLIAVEKTVADQIQLTIGNDFTLEPNDTKHVFFYVKLIDGFADAIEDITFSAAAIDGLDVDFTPYTIDTSVCVEPVVPEEDDAGAAGAWLIDKFVAFFTTPTAYAQVFDFEIDHEPTPNPVLVGAPDDLNCDDLTTYIRPDYSSLLFVGPGKNTSSFVSMESFDFGRLNDDGTFISLTDDSGEPDLGNLPVGLHDFYAKVKYRELGPDFDSAIDIEKYVHFQTVNNKCARVIASAEADRAECNLDNFNTLNVNTITLTVDNPTSEDVLITGIKVGDALNVIDTSIQSGNVEVFDLTTSETIETVTINYQVNEVLLTKDVAIDDVDVTPCSESVTLVASDSVSCNAVLSDQNISLLIDYGVDFEDAEVADINFGESISRGILKIKQEDDFIKPSDKLVIRIGDAIESLDYVEENQGFVLPEMAEGINSLKVVKFNENVLLEHGSSYNIVLKIGDFELESEFELDCSGGVYVISKNEIGFDGENPDDLEDLIVPTCENVNVNFSYWNYGFDQLSFIDAEVERGRSNVFSSNMSLSSPYVTSFSEFELDGLDDSWRKVGVSRLQNQCMPLEIDVQPIKIFNGQEDDVLSCFTKSNNQRASDQEQIIPNRFEVVVTNVSTSELRLNKLVFDDLNDNYVVVKHRDELSDNEDFLIQNLLLQPFTPVKFIVDVLNSNKINDESGFKLDFKFKAVSELFAARDFLAKSLNSNCNIFQYTFIGDSVDTCPLFLDVYSLDHIFRHDRGFEFKDLNSRDRDFVGDRFTLNNFRVEYDTEYNFDFQMKDEMIISEFHNRFIAGYDSEPVIFDSSECIDVPGSETEACNLPFNKLIELEITSGSNISIEFNSGFREKGLFYYIFNPADAIDWSSDPGRGLLHDTRETLNIENVPRNADNIAIYYRFPPEYAGENLIFNVSNDENAFVYTFNPRFESCKSIDVCIVDDQVVDSHLAEPQMYTNQFSVYDGWAMSWKNTGIYPITIDEIDFNLSEDSKVFLEPRFSVGFNGLLLNPELRPYARKQFVEYDFDDGTYRSPNNFVFTDDDLYLFDVDFSDPSNPILALGSSNYLKIIFGEDYNRSNDVLFNTILMPKSDVYMYVEGAFVKNNENLLNIKENNRVNPLVDYIQGNNASKSFTNQLKYRNIFQYPHEFRNDFNKDLDTDDVRNSEDLFLGNDNYINTIFTSPNLVPPHQFLVDKDSDSILQIECGSEMPCQATKFALFGLPMGPTVNQDNYENDPIGKDFRSSEFRFPHPIAYSCENVTEEPFVLNFDNRSVFKDENLEYDRDSDGVLDVEVDNCPFDYNPDQLDIDNDGEGNVCDDDYRLPRVEVPDRGFPRGRGGL